MTIMIQDVYRNSPWKMLVAVVLLNRAKGTKVREMLPQFFVNWKRPPDLAHADHDRLVKFLEPLGFQEKRATVLKDMSANFLQTGNVSELVSMTKGLGDYAIESVEVFLKRNAEFDAQDKEVKPYLERAKSQDEFVDRARTTLSISGERNKDVVELFDWRYAFDQNLFTVPTDHKVSKSHAKSLRQLHDVPNALVHGDQHRWGEDTSEQFRIALRGGTLRFSVWQCDRKISELANDCDAYARAVCKICESMPAVDNYVVNVFVGRLYN